MRRTTLRMLQTAPPYTFLVFERKTDKLIGVVRHHMHLEDEHYWTVGDGPDSPSYRTRAEAILALQTQQKRSDVRKYIVACYASSFTTALVRVEFWARSFAEAEQKARDAGLIPIRGQRSR